MRILVHIDGHVYAPTIDWERTREAIVSTARSGGGFVVLVGTTGAAEVFVSHASTIYAESVEDEQVVPAPEDRFPDFGIDQL